MAQLIIGLGSGRSGSTSLARFFSEQPDSFFCHEGAYDRPRFLRYTFGHSLSWDIDDAEFEKWLAGLTRAAGDAKYFGDCALYLLPYTERILAARPEARFICIKRERAATVRSLLRANAGVNPWQKSPAGKQNRWERIFPKFEGVSREEAAIRYWDLYYSIAEE
ncbi:MAG: hypothetical protein ACREGR_02365, partial [Minisyncoccia bacterium]